MKPKYKATFFPNGCLFAIVCVGNNLEEIFLKFEKKYKRKNDAIGIPPFTMILHSNL